MTEPQRQPTRRLPIALFGVASVMAACTPIVSVPVAGAPPSPSPTVASPVTARPSPTPGPHDLAIEAFVASIADGLTYRTEFEGRVAGSADLGEVSGHIDTNGTDFAARYDYDFREDSPGIPVLTAGYRGVDGTGYLRIESQQGWDEISGYDPTAAAIPFAAVRSARDVRLVEVETTESGEERYVVGIGGSLVLHPWTIPGRVSDERIRSTRMRVTLDGEGRPLAGTWELDATGRVGTSGQLQQITADLELVFSRLGEPVDIEAP